MVQANGAGWGRLEYLGQVGLGQGVLRLCATGWDWDRGVFRLIGTGWDWDRGVFQLNQFTCPKVGLQGGEN